MTKNQKVTELYLMATWATRWAHRPDPRYNFTTAAEAREFAVNCRAQARALERTPGL